MPQRIQSPHMICRSPVILHFSIFYIILKKSFRKGGTALIQEKITPQMLVASAHHFVESVSDNLIAQFTDDFEKNLAETGAKKKEPERFFTVFHIDAYRDRDYEMELWVQVEDCMQNSEHITFKTIPECEVAFIIVPENYENLKDSYDSLFDYVREHGLNVLGYPKETYIFDDSAALGYFTEIQLPFSRPHCNAHKG